MLLDDRLMDQGQLRGRTGYGLDTSLLLLLLLDTFGWICADDV